MGHKIRTVIYILAAISMIASALLFQACSGSAGEGAATTAAPAATSAPAGNRGGGAPPSGTGTPGGAPGAFNSQAVATAAATLGIDATKLQAAITQAQSELGTSTATPPTGTPPAGQTPPTGSPSGTPPAMSDNATRPQGTGPGGMFGANDKLMTRVAELLGIDLQKLQQAFGQPTTTAK